MVSVFLLFFFSVALGKHAADVILYMNDSEKLRTWKEWAVFMIGTPIFTGVWCATWVWFKVNEKKCVDHFCARGN